MASIKSRDFVGIAEGIKTHELSTKGKIESLKKSTNLDLDYIVNDICEFFKLK